MKLKYLVIIITLFLVSGCKKGSLTRGPASIKTPQSSEQEPEQNQLPIGEDDAKKDAENRPLSEDDTEGDGGRPVGEDDTGGDESRPIGEDDTGDESRPIGEDDTGDESRPLGQDDGGTPYSFSVTQTAYANKQVDIVLNIDNSGSMIPNHQDLKYRFGDFFSGPLQLTQWQMLFMSSADGNAFYSLIDMNEQKLTDHILSPAFDTFEEIFMNTISSKQHNGSSTGELVALLDMIKNTENASSFRKDALLAILIITDDKATEPEGDIVKAVQERFGVSKDFVVYGIIWEPGDSSCREDGQGPLVAQLVKETGGITESICSPDYSSVMNNIGEHIEKKLSFQEISLKHKNVIKDSVKLKFKPSANKQKWDHDEDANKVTFKTPPIEGTTIEISYSYQPETN